MRKKLLFGLLIVLILPCIFMLSACSNKPCINFISDEEIYYSVSSYGNEKINLPSEPQKDGYVFDGWYLDKDVWQEPFTEDSLLYFEIKSNVQVYAKWTGIFNHSNGCITRLTTYGESLTDITIPNAIDNTPITKISDYAFEDSENLTLIRIGSNVTEIGDYSFKGCSNLTSVTMPETLTNIGEYAFGGCVKLIDFNIPSTVRYIGDYAFYYCSGLTDITIPDGITTISEGSFYYCSGLKSISIPESVSSIEIDSFSGCSSLGKANIKNINKWVLIDFASIESNPLYYGASLYLNGDLATNIVLDNGITKIKNYAFARCDSLKSITIPESVTTIGDSAFYMCSFLSEVNMSEGIKKIGNDAFYFTVSLTTINLPESLTIIGSRAFMLCNIITITIPEKTEQIGVGAFTLCNRLVEIYNKSDLVITPTSYGLSNTYNANINIYTDPENSKLLKENGFVFFVNEQTYELVGYEGKEKDIILPSMDFNYAIRAYAFFANLNLISVFIPECVTTIGESAFSNCTNLKNVSMSERSVSTINQKAFYYCKKLEEVNLSNNLASIFFQAFAFCNSLTKISIPSKIILIGEEVFSGCNNLQEISLPRVSLVPALMNNSIYPIGYLFGSTAYEGSIKVEQYYSYTGYDEAQGSVAVYHVLGSYYIPSSLKQVTITNDNITEYAFQNCKNLSVIIPSNISNIDHTAFWDCENVTIYSEGTAEAWNEDWYLDNLPVYWYSETQPTTSGNYWHYVDGVATIW